MYEFRYDYIKNKYGNKSLFIDKLKINLLIINKLLFTDTDSLMYEIKTKDVYVDFNCDKEMFDLSNYLTKSKYYADSNKLAIR